MSIKRADFTPFSDETGARAPGPGKQVRSPSWQLQVTPMTLFMKSPNSAIDSLAYRLRVVSEWAAQGRAVALPCARAERFLLAMDNFAASVEYLWWMSRRKILMFGNQTLPLESERRWLSKSGLFETVFAFLFRTVPQRHDVLVSHYPAILGTQYEAAFPSFNYQGPLHQKSLVPTDKVKFTNVGWDADFSSRCL